MNILLFRTGGIGDVILTTPLIRQIKKNLPKSKIDYLVGEKPGPVLENNPYLNQVIEFNENIVFKKRFFRLLKLIFKIFKKDYDVVFVLGKHWVYGVISYFFGIKKRIGFKRKRDLFLTDSVDYNKVRHESLFYLDLLKKIDIKPDYNDTSLEAYLDKNAKDFANKFFKKNNLDNQKVIALSPGGGTGKNGKEIIKRWPKEKWPKLIKLLKESDFVPLLVGGESDKNLEKYIFKKESSLSLIGKTNLLETGAILSKCKAIVCSDSGLAHLSAALNGKVLSIFGPTDPKRFAPLNKNSKYLFNDNLKCSPCYDLYGDFNMVCDNQRTCFRSITPELVFKELKNLI